MWNRGAPSCTGTRPPPRSPWTDEARARLAVVPSFVRGVVSQRVESFARKRGYTAVTAEVMAEVRRGIPVDFSKRLPFFLRNQMSAGASRDGIPEEDDVPRN